MKLRRAEDRKKLYFRMKEYEKRRDKLRDYYGVVIGRNTEKAPEAYKREVKRLNQGIRRYQRGIAEIDKRTIQIIAIGNLLAYFMGVCVKKSGKSMLPKVKLARVIFYKYCLEHDIHGTLVSEYVGVHQNTAAKGREAFTKSFSKHPENREIYNRFKTYVEEFKTRGVDQPTEESL